jgi:hypothetical protein
MVLTALALAILIGTCAYSWTIQTSNAPSTLPSIELTTADSLAPQVRESHPTRLRLISIRISFADFQFRDFQAVNASGGAVRRSF